MRIFECLTTIKRPQVIIVKIAVRWRRTVFIFAGCFQKEIVFSLKAWWQTDYENEFSNYWNNINKECRVHNGRKKAAEWARHDLVTRNCWLLAIPSAVIKCRMASVLFHLVNRLVRLLLALAGSRGDFSGANDRNVKRRAITSVGSRAMSSVKSQLVDMWVGEER